MPGTGFWANRDSSSELRAGGSLIRCVEMAMQLRRRSLVVVCFISLAAVIGYTIIGTTGDAQAKLAIVVANQRLVRTSVRVSVIASNSGPSTLVNGGSCEVRYELEGKWTTNSFGGHRSSIYWLLPGETRHQSFDIPRQAARFQAGYSFDVAGPLTRTSIACRLGERGWLDKLHWALELLPRRAATYRDFWGPECRVAPNPD